MSIFDDAFAPYSGIPAGILPPGYSAPQGNFSGGRSVLSDLLQSIAAGAQRGLGSTAFGGNYGANTIQPYTPQQLPSSVADLVKSGTGQSPAYAPPLSAPQNVAALPQGGAGIPQDQNPTIPSAAKPAAFSAPPPLPPLPQQQQGASSGPNGLEQLASILIPSLRSQYTQTGTDILGHPQYGFVNALKQTVNGQPAGGGSQGGNNFSIPPDVASNPQAAKEYIQKNYPAAMPYIEAIHRGDASVTGRMVQNFLPVAAMVYPDLQQYDYDARKKMAIDYRSSTFNSAGGQRNAGNTAIGHLATVLKAAQDLQNTNLPGGAAPDIAHMINWVRQHGTADQSAKANALNDAVDRYVEEVKKYYSGSATGGVGERDAARSRLSALKTGPELAAAIGTEADLFKSKLDQLQQSRLATFGDEATADQATGGPVLQPHAQQALKYIQQNLPQLKNGTAPQQAQAARVASKADWDKLPKGTTYIAPDGSTRIKQ